MLPLALRGRVGHWPEPSGVSGGGVGGSGGIQGGRGGVGGGVGGVGGVGGTGVGVGGTGVGVGGTGVGTGVGADFHANRIHPSPVSITTGAGE